MVCLGIGPFFLETEKIGKNMSRKYHKNKKHLYLKAGNFTKITQMVYYSYVSLFLFSVFSLINEDYSCLKCWISTKLSQIVCLINLHIFLIWWHTRCYCRQWNNLWLYIAHFGHFKCLKRYIFIKICPNFVQPYVYNWLL